KPSLVTRTPSVPDRRSSRCSNGVAPITTPRFASVTRAPAGSELMRTRTWVGAGGGASRGAGFAAGAGAGGVTAGAVVAAATAGVAATSPPDLPLPCITTNPPPIAMTAATLAPTTRPRLLLAAFADG